jgi:hypothetical protein
MKCIKRKTSFVIRPSSFVVNGDVEKVGGASFGCLASTVVARGGRYVGVSGQPLHGRYVGPSVEQITYHSAPQVVRREMAYTRFHCTL